METNGRKVAYLKHAKISHGLSDRDVELLSDVMRLVSYRKGQIIFMPKDTADSVFVLHSGYVKLSRIGDDGRELTISTVGPGETFGEVDVLAEHPRDSMAEVMEGGVVGVVSKKNFERFLKYQPQCCLNLSRLIGARMAQVEQRIEHFVFLDAPERLACLLLDLIRPVKSSYSDRSDLKISCTHQGLANIIGTTRETVSIVLGQLQEARLLATGNRFVRILDEKRLHCFVDNQYRRRNAGGHARPLHSVEAHASSVSIH
tara:strand:- start:4702 stop:5478 length:777 start_codon:yes stop_codon:yes gene_type:complete